MASIFSVQNLQTFLRRKYFRPPSRDPPGPPPGRGPRGPRSLRSGRSPPLRSGRASLVAAGVLVSSAIVLLRTSDLSWDGAALQRCDKPAIRCRASAPEVASLDRCRLRFRPRFRRSRSDRRRRTRLLARFADLLDLVEPLQF